MRLCSLLALSWVSLLSWEQCETKKLLSLLSSIDLSTFKKDILCSSQILLLCVPTCVAGVQLWLVICAVGFVPSSLDGSCKQSWVLPAGLALLDCWFSFCCLEELGKVSQLTDELPGMATHSQN